MRNNRNCKDDAPNEKEFERLLNIAGKSDDPVFYRFMLYCLGRLGMRMGEFAHIKKHWLDFQRKTITIPKHEPCCCYYCRYQFKERTKRKNVDDKELMKTYWQPKTDNAHRTIPYDIDNEIVDAVESFFDKYSEIPYSLGHSRDRLKMLCKRASVDSYPHGLRAASATKFIQDGVPALALMTLMGWKDLDVATRYIAHNEAYTSQKLREIYSLGNNKLSHKFKSRVLFLTRGTYKLFRRKDL
jgi:integrase